MAINKLLQYVFLCICTFCVLPSSADDGTNEVEDYIVLGLRGTLKAIELPLSVARGRAEDLFTYKGGTALDNALDVGSNEYFSQLRICTNYWIKLQFPSARANSDEISGTDEIPTPPVTFGKIIYLVPVYDNGDYRITTWECVTNLGLDRSTFKGDSKAGADMDGSVSTASRALLAKYTNDAILEKCVYAEGTTEGAQWKTIDDAVATACSVPD